VTHVWWKLFSSDAREGVFAKWPFAQIRLRCFSLSKKKKKKKKKIKYTKNKKNFSTTEKEQVKNFLSSSVKVRRRRRRDMGGRIACQKFRQRGKG
jgi:hypothetical protein